LNTTLQENKFTRFFLRMTSMLELKLFMNCICSLDDPL